MKVLEFGHKKIDSVDKPKIHSAPQVYEKCVVCGKTTDILINLPVSVRKGYMPGVGQLCWECCVAIYGTDDLRWLS